MNLVHKYLFVSLLVLTIFLDTGSPIDTVYAAELELDILTIEGDMIGKIESLDANATPSTVIAAYYKLLLVGEQAKIEHHYNRYLDLIPDYNVAFAAADSAEITEVRTDIDAHWAIIRTFHSRLYKQEVVEVLDAAYDRLFAAKALSGVSLQTKQD